jgi:hypothetical protein
MISSEPLPSNRSNPAGPQHASPSLGFEPGLTRQRVAVQCDRCKTLGELLRIASGRLAGNA